MSANVSLILHLSDLHFGEKAASDIIHTVQFELAHSTPRHHHVRTLIRLLPRKPDYVIVSGDITVQADPQGFEEFNSFCTDLIRKGLLPPPDRFLIVPGNHDVVRVPQVGPLNEAERWQTFHDAFGGFAQAWIPSVSRKKTVTEMVQAAVSTFKPGFAGGISEDVALPFIFDPKDGILLYGFNSAAISGTRLVIPDEVNAAIQYLDTAKVSKPVATNWRVIRKYLLANVMVDPAMVLPDDLGLFHEIAAALREKYQEKYEAAVKIAVLHHHVATMPMDQIKPFELLLNAAQFKEETWSEGFGVVCHGHKHRRCAFMDADAPAGARQLIIAGGTVGGYTPVSAPQPGFYLLDASATTVGVQFNGMDEAGALTREVRRDFPLPIRKQKASALPVRIQAGSITAAAAKALAGNVRKTTIESGTVVEGWPHRIEGAGRDQRASATSTAFALRLLSFAKPLPPDVSPLVRKGIAALSAFRRPWGGWKSKFEGEGMTPETTGWVAMALHDWSETVPQQELAPIFSRLLDESDDGRRYTFSVAHVMHVLADLYPESDILPSLTELLIEGAIRDSNGITGWAAMLGSNKYSPLHTAYACIALQKLSVPPDLTAVRERLRVPPWPDPHSDEIERGTGHLYVGHYAAPVVVRALLDLGVDPLDEYLHEAVAEIAGAQQDGLWQWNGENKPVWASYDAVAALHAWAARL